jgi:hypothetical protein
MLCGNNGDVCDICGTDEECINGVCTPTTTNPCTGATNGTTSCTDSAGKQGICYDGSCCSGCWDSLLGQCYPGTGDTSCGAGGTPCDDCTDSGKSCAGGTCISNNPCQGETGGTKACTDSAGDSGHCWENQCCTTCWDTDSSQCVTALTDTDCGADGVSCDDCTSTNEVCNTSTGTCVPSSSSVCSGEVDYTPCTENSLSGVCISEQCCTTCYYIEFGLPMCSLSGTTAMACGSDGDACETCLYPQECTFFECVYPATSKWTLQVNKAWIENHEGDSPPYYWDDNQGKPDVFAVIDFDTTRCSSDWSLWPTEYTSTIDDDYVPVWSHDIQHVELSDMREFCVSLWDDDSWLTGNTLIGTCKVTISNVDLDLRDAYKFGCPNPDDGEDWVNYIYFKLTPE